MMTGRGGLLSIFSLSLSFCLLLALSHEPEHTQTISTHSCYLKLNFHKEDAILARLNLIMSSNGQITHYISQPGLILTHKKTFFYIEMEHFKLF